jgi:endonuclease/exonuclease/phosphatase family metal-dependent hydrolase
MTLIPAEDSPGSARRRGRRRWRRALIAAAALVVLAPGGVAWWWWWSPRGPAGPATGTGLSGPPAVSATGRTIRVAAFNIHAGKGRDGRRDLARTAEQLKGLDLICLNEVAGPGPWGGEDQASVLGRRLKMPHLFAASERRWGHESYGNALLCVLPVGHWVRIPLPATRTRGFRNAVLAEVRVGPERLNVLLTHVDRNRDREAQLRGVIALYLALAPPAVLMGDLNSRASDPQLKSLLARPDVTDAAAGARGDRRSRRDWIIVRGLRVVSAGVRATDASDHPVVRAELELPAAPAGEP